ncbi:DUF3142 domain-containing protein [bacterium]|nr:DUF3142 domain-containing protein [bacterium]
MKTIFTVFIFIFTLWGGLLYAMPMGQWIWTLKDRDIYVESQKKVPHLIPTIWAGTLFYKNGKITPQLSLSPSIVSTSQTVVIRLDNSLHGAFKNFSQDELNHKLADALSFILNHLHTISEIQLDYDCPIALLKKWSDLLSFLKEDLLKKKTLWITSLASHIKEPQYGELFKNKVAGHILQLFDTGEDVDAQNVLDWAEKAHIPYRIGLGAFERIEPHNKKTMHSFWFSKIHFFKTSPLFCGVWVFPSAHPWTQLLEIFYGKNYKAL